MKLSVKIAKKLLENAGYKVSIDDSNILTEMAFDKHEIQFELKNKFSQIYQNWCLLQYIKLSKDKTELGNHWSEELLTLMMSISGMKLIKGNKREKVYDYLKEMYYTKMEFDMMDLNIYCRLIKKFQNENITFDLDILQDDFKKNVDELFKMMAFSNEKEIETYCYSFWKI